MHVLRPALLTLALAALSASAVAQQQTVYEWKDAKGVTHYTDTPPSGAHKVREISRANTPAAAKPAPAATWPGCKARRPSAWMAMATASRTAP